MRRIYTFFFYFALPFIFLRLLWQARSNPAYAQDWSERLGYFKKKLPQDCIWVHAVSVGEVIAAIPLIKGLQKTHIPIVITTTTPTGRDRVHAAFSKTVTHCYLPYDYPAALLRLITKIKPKLLILIETELWPNLLYVCKTQNIPVFLANGRLSERSAKGYARIGFLTTEMMRNITSLAAQTQIESQRFIALGLNPNAAHVTGSIKFDLEIPHDLVDKAKALREQFGKQRFVWIAASTHEGEEEQVLAAFKVIRTKIPNALLILVPRHMERFEKVITLCKKENYNLILRSENKPCDATTDIFIGNSMGELLLFYAASDIAFVGGSLIATGGHNPLEPAALGLPVLMGPHLFNFAAISEQLQKQQAMLKIQNPEELAAAVIDLFNNAEKRQQMGQKGKNFVAQNKGALDKHLSLIKELLESEQRLVFDKRGEVNFSEP